jgi:hypothetical protein
MNRALVASLIALAASACAYRPVPTELVRIVDTSADVRACRRLSEVSPPVTTTPGFGRNLEAMLESTVALGGTDLLVDRRSHDWLVVRGVAYDCNRTRAPERVVVRAAG